MKNPSDEALQRLFDRGDRENHWIALWFTSEIGQENPAAMLGTTRWAEQAIRCLELRTKDDDVVMV